MNDLFHRESPWGKALSDEQRLDWLRLIRSENVGAVTFRKLINRFGGAAEALQALPAMASRGGAARPLKLCSREEAEREMEAVYAFDARLVAPLEVGYPPLLNLIDQPPPLLTMKGNLDQVSLPALAVVGTRNCSGSGRSLTRTFAKAITEEGFLLVSGLARGVDIVAHEHAVLGRTMAVLAGGLDRIYPHEHKPKVDALLGEGAVIVSEMPMGWQARGVDFPRRNRIIAGSSFGTLVVEAARRSGSLITARLAGEFGRLVFAVPGSPIDPRAEGPNHLIREGAILVTKPKDMLDEIAPMIDRPEAIKPGRLDETYFDDADYEALDDVPVSARDRVLSALSSVATPLDDLLATADVEPNELQVVLLELELAGRLERQAGQRVALIA